MMAEGGEEDKSQIIAHFQELTGIDDHDKCVEILSTHQWNLEASIQDALNEREGRTPIYTPPSPPQTPPLGDQPPGLRRRIQVPVTRYAQPVTGTVARPRQGWWDWLMNLALFPLRFTVTSATDLFQLLMSLLFGLRPSPARDPTADVQQFVSEFEAEYGTQHPRFLTCGYDQALAKAKEDLQFLLVYVHSPLHRDTPQFCKEVLCSHEFVEFAGERLLMWGVGLNTQEGARVSYILRENSYPFLALVVLKHSRLVVCERVEGTLPTTEALLQRLQAAITNNEAELVVERNERHRRMFDQQLREDQDAAYQQSLAADREKERLKQEQLQKEAELAKQVQDKLEEEKKQKEEFEIDRAKRVSRLPPEPAISDPSAITVSLRLPSGYRLERRFNETDQLESVYDFAYTGDSDQLPQKFTLITNFPRKKLQPDSNGGPQLLDLQLGKRCALYVQDAVETD